MPTYEYVCNRCGHDFERVQRFSDEPVKVCPVCSGSVRRVIHTAGIIFKGSGWYVTDHGRGSSGGARSSNGRGAKSGRPAEARETKEAKESKDSGSESVPAPAKDTADE